MSPPRERPVKHPELGAALRRAREAAGISGNQLAKGTLGWNQAKVSLVENGRQTPTEADVIAWADATSADRATLLELREQSVVQRLDIRQAARRPGGVEALQGELEKLEVGSTTITEYQPTVIAGLAQTAGYTRAWLEQPARVELGGPIDVEQIVRRRAERQRRLADRTIVVVTTSMALGAAYGPVDVQREQLDHLIVGVESGLFEVVIPGRPVAMLQGFELLDDVVIVENVTGAHVMSAPEVVAAFRTSMQAIRRDAVSPAAVLEEIRGVRDSL